MFFKLSVSLALASLACAAPSLEKKSSETCGGLNGIAGFFDTAFNFTLATLNQTLPNANGTGAPLVLGPIGETGGVHLEALSTFASVPLNDWPNLSMLSGTLIANMQVPGLDPIPTVATQVASGSPILFSTSSNQPLAPNPVFCAIASTDPNGSSQPFPVLAVGTDADSFSLCKNGQQDNIVYQAAAVNDGSYDFSTCHAVTVIIHEP